MPGIRLIPRMTGAANRAERAGLKQPATQIEPNGVTGEPAVNRTRRFGAQAVTRSKACSLYAESSPGRALNRRRLPNYCVRVPDGLAAADFGSGFEAAGIFVRLLVEPLCRLARRLRRNARMRARRRA